MTSPWEQWLLRTFLFSIRGPERPHPGLWDCSWGLHPGDIRGFTSGSRRRGRESSRLSQPLGRSFLEGPHHSLFLGFVTSTVWPGQPPHKGSERASGRPGTCHPPDTVSRRKEGTPVCLLSSPGPAAQPLCLSASLRSGLTPGDDHTEHPPSGPALPPGCRKVPPGQDLPPRHSPLLVLRPSAGTSGLIIPSSAGTRMRKGWLEGKMGSLWVVTTLSVFPAAGWGRIKNWVKLLKLMVP